MLHTHPRLATHSHTHPPTRTHARTHTHPPTHSPISIQYLITDCGHLAIMQLDGNFALYDPKGEVYFSSATSGQGLTPNRVTLKATGELVMFDSLGRYALCVLPLFLSRSVPNFVLLYLFFSHRLYAFPSNSLCRPSHVSLSLFFLSSGPKERSISALWGEEPTPSALLSLPTLSC